MERETNTTLAIKLNSKEDQQCLNFNFLNRKLGFFKFPCEILNLEIALSKNSSQENKDKEEAGLQTKLFYSVQVQ